MSGPSVAGSPETTSAPARRAGSVQSVDRAAALLRAVASSGPANASELAAACGLNRATAYRILTTLERHVLVERDRATGCFRIGRGVVELAGTVGRASVVARARPVLERLSAQVGQTAALAVPSGGSLVYVDEVIPGRVLAASWLGQPVPFHATSTGKAYLAALDAGDLLAFLEPELVRFTDTTLTTREALLEELAATRERGYGTCRGELEETLDGVSAAVLDDGRPVAVISLWWPVGRSVPVDVEQAGRAAYAAAREVSALVGTAPTPVRRGR